MDFSLTPEQQAVQSRARAFAQQEVAPLAREADATGVFPLHLVKRMGELGFLAGPIAPEYGGAGMDYLSFALVYEELGRADSSVRGFLAVHAGLVSLCLRDWGSDEQRRQYLPRLATGEWIGCYCLTEPNAGSDAASIATTAREEADGYVLNGEKIWITNGNVADVAIVFATHDPAARHKGICAFVVPTDAPGFRREQLAGQPLGHRAGGGPGLPGRMCRLHAPAPSVRAADRRLRDDPGQPGRHGRRRGGSAAAGLPRGLDEAAGPAHHPRDLDRQAVRHRGGGEGGLRGRPDPRRARLRERVPGRALLPRHQGPADLRGHQPHPADRDRARAGWARAGIAV